MNTNVAPREMARLIVEQHTRGKICSGEVYNKFVDNFTSETFADFMAALTPDLHTYFRHHILGCRPALCSDDTERRVLNWLSDYFKTQV